jgi:hypothetical protein
MQSFVTASLNVILEVLDTIVSQEKEKFKVLKGREY